MERANKKAYHTPQLSSFVIDKEIALVMASPGNPGGDPEGAPAASGAYDATFDANTFKEDPFKSK